MAHLPTHREGREWAVTGIRHGRCCWRFRQRWTPGSVCGRRKRRNHLYHNNGDGTFSDVTDKAGVGGGMHDGEENVVSHRGVGGLQQRRIAGPCLWRITASGIHATNLSAWAWMAAATVTPEASLRFLIRYIATMETAHSLMFRRRLGISSVTGQGHGRCFCRLRRGWFS